MELNDRLPAQTGMIIGQRERKSLAFSRFFCCCLFVFPPIVVQVLLWDCLVLTGKVTSGFYSVGEPCLGGILP